MYLFRAVVTQSFDRSEMIQATRSVVHGDDTLAAVEQVVDFELPVEEQRQRCLGALKETAGCARVVRRIP
jgi:Ni,Fe-hydrogenase III large subunit